MEEKQNSSFDVLKKQFWILEVKVQNKPIAVVFQKLECAIERTVEYLNEEPDITKVEPKNYSLQEVEIADDKYNIKPVSWFLVLTAYAKQMKSAKK
jgi:hypothetical protein